MERLAVLLALRLGQCPVKTQSQDNALTLQGKILRQKVFGQDRNGNARLKPELPDLGDCHAPDDHKYLNTSKIKSSAGAVVTNLSVY